MIGPLSGSAPSGDDDSWESLAENLFGIEFRRGVEDDDLGDDVDCPVAPPPAAVPVAEEESPDLDFDEEPESGFSEEEDLGFGDEPEDEPAPVARPAFEDRRPAPKAAEEPRPERAPSTPPPAARGDDPFWDTLNEFDWDDATARRRPPAAPAASDEPMPDRRPVGRGEGPSERRPSRHEEPEPVRRSPRREEAAKDRREIGRAEPSPVRGAARRDEPMRGVDREEPAEEHRGIPSDEPADAGDESRGPRRRRRGRRRGGAGRTEETSGERETSRFAGEPEPPPSETPRSETPRSETPRSETPRSEPPVSRRPAARRPVEPEPIADFDDEPAESDDDDFGSGVSEPKSRGGRRPASRREEPRGESPRPAVRPTVSEESFSEPAESDEDAGEESGERPRRRRGRRRPRDEAGTAPEFVAERSPEPADEDEPAPARRPRRGSRTGREPAETSAVEMRVSEAPAAFKNVPTWEQAIALLVHRRPKQTSGWTPDPEDDDEIEPTADRPREPRSGPAARRRRRRPS